MAARGAATRSARSSMMPIAASNAGGTLPGMIAMGRVMAMRHAARCALALAAELRGQTATCH